MLREAFSKRKVNNYKMGLGSWGQRGLPGSSVGKKKNPPVMQETPVRFLDQEDPLEKR